MVRTIGVVYGVCAHDRSGTKRGAVKIRVKRKMLAIDAKLSREREKLLGANGRWMGNLNEDLIIEGLKSAGPINEGDLIRIGKIIFSVKRSVPLTPIWPKRDDFNQLVKGWSGYELVTRTGMQKYLYTTWRVNFEPANAAPHISREAATKIALSIK